MTGIYITTLISLIIFVIAQLKTPNEYNWVKNTVSELAAQKYENRRIMQAGFILFGIMLSGSILFNIFINGYDFYKNFPIFLYALCIGISGLYCTHPFIPGIQFIKKESKIHSFLAQLAGVFFEIGILISILETSDLRIQILHAVTFVFILCCFLLFRKSNNYRGLIQRLLYLGSFLWLLFIYPL